MIKKEYSVLYRAKCSAHVNHLYKLLLTEGLDPEVAQEIKQSIYLLHRSIPCVVEQKIKNAELSTVN